VELCRNGFIPHIVEDGGHEKAYRLDRYIYEEEAEGADCGVDVEDGHADVVEGYFFV
jgi:hypothetical protein